MKGRLAILTLSVLAGGAVWVCDALLDHLFFYQRSFWDLLIADVPAHEVYTRAVAFVMFVAFGQLVSLMWRDRLQAVEDAKARDALFESLLRHTQKTEAVGTLAARIAHDFNNLLVAIFGYTDLARGAIPDGHPAIKSLQMVEEAAHRARGVANAMLAFVRDESAGKKPMNMVEVLADSMRLCRYLAPPEIDFVEDSSSEHRIWVNADAHQIRHAFANLVIHACDSMPDGGCLRISLAKESVSPTTCVAQDDAYRNSHAVIVIEDTGAGLSDNDRSRVFEPAYTTTPGKQAVKLGLSVAHGIVADHAGRLDVDSQPGGGTRVTVRLPCCQPSHGGPGGCSGGGERRSGEMIIVVEADQQIRSIMTSMLRRQGYEVVQAPNGAKAIGVLDSHHDAVRLVLLDLDLPGGTGLRCLRDIRRRQPDLPIVLTTGHANSEADEHADENTSILRKPFQMAELMSLTDRMLNHSTLYDGVPI